MQKNYTFIVVSDHKGTTKKIVLPATWIKAGVFAIAILLIVGAAGFVDYTGLLFQSVENKRLKSENSQLKRQFAQVDSKLTTLEKDMERIQSFATKLGMITNANDNTSGVSLAMGPLPRPGQSIEEMTESVDEREPASVMVNKDRLFFEKAPLDTRNGELFSEGRNQVASLSIRLDKLKKESSLKEQNIIHLWESLSHRQSLLRAIPSIKPTRGWETSKFGYRKSPFTGRPAMHNGLDLAAPPGTPIYAAADGVIAYAGYDAGYGKLISLDHGYGTVTRYGHVSKIYVSVGQKIRRGEVIGAVGNTGRSTGPHLHYEVRVNNVPMDPKNYILQD